MHSFNGALSESLYIYGEALRLALLRPGPLRLLSFGLGLGYNELISIAILRKSGRLDWKIFSFESLPFLKRLVSPVGHGRIAVKVERRHRASGSHDRSPARPLDPADLRRWTQEALGQGQLELRGAFLDDVAAVDSCNLVYYDAYSNKMDPTLWMETQFESALNDVLDVDCILATYAATGSLNRAAKRLGFRLKPKPGFKGKRERIGHS